MLEFAFTLLIVMIPVTVGFFLFRFVYFLYCRFQHKKHGTSNRWHIKKSSLEIGTQFEILVKERLKQIFCKNFEDGSAKILHNIRLKEPYYTDQIDLLLIDFSGLYIIECKNWSGLIIGRHDWESWLQVRCHLTNGIPTKDRNRNLSVAMYNSPYKQVNSQRNCLDQFLRTSEVKMIRLPDIRRIVVTADHTDMSFVQLNDPEDGQKKHFWMGKMNQLHNFIHASRKITPIESILTKEGVEKIYQTLLPYSSDRMR